MKYLFLDCFAFLSPCMLAGALYDMTKNKETLEKLCNVFDEPSITISEEKRCGMEAELIRLNYKEDKENITKAELNTICEKLDADKKTKEQLTDYINLLAQAKSIDPDSAVFEAKTAEDSLVFLAYILETIFSLKADAVYVSKIIIPSDVCGDDDFKEKIFNSEYILKKHNIRFDSVSVLSPSFTEEWAAMYAVLNASQKSTKYGSIIKTGYGAGEDDTENIPNILRAVYGEDEDGELLYEAEASLDLNFEFA